ncbi:pepsin/retropepsin-like aspartic protease family protein [Microbulbifer variabilis]|uniref:pepsin/retropepsin-like aspartic protease family protein n=1 Tax=Microbulbifer variabilis TaxID=266805 RepID=UPI001CFC978E|nr:aspartyl protease family protein [Microbulbifer variabilis]
MKTIVSSLAIAAIIAGCSTIRAPVQAPLTSLPMKMTSAGHAYVYGDIDQVQDYPLIIDTAANFGVLPERLQGKLQLAEEDLHIEEIQGATGKREMMRGTVGHTSLRGETVPNIDFIFQDMQSLTLSNGLIPGIIGHNYLRHYCIEFDFIHSQFNLAKGGCPTGKVESLRALPFHIEDEFIKLQASFAGENIDAILDTGAHHSFINSALLPLLRNVEHGKQSTSSGLGGHQQNKTEIQQVNYKLGNYSILEPIMFVADLSVFDDLGYNNKPILLLGLDLFRSGRLIIDYQNRNIYF